MQNLIKRTSYHNFYDESTIHIVYNGADNVTLFLEDESGDSAAEDSRIYFTMDLENLDTLIDTLNQFRQELI